MCRLMSNKQRRRSNAHRRTDGPNNVHVFVCVCVSRGATREALLEVGRRRLRLSVVAVLHGEVNTSIQHVLLGELRSVVYVRDVYVYSTHEHEHTHNRLEADNCGRMRKPKSHQTYACALFPSSELICSSPNEFVHSDSMPINSLSMS